MSERGVSLFLEHLKGQAQFAYFQLGLTASAIAFAIHQTDNQALRDTPWPTGVAVALWAGSFALGCFGLGARQNALLRNAKYLFMLSDADAIQLQHHPEIAKAIKEAGQTVEEAGERSLTRFRWQLWTLFGGALFYIAGHLMDMAAVS